MAISSRARCRDLIVAVATALTLIPAGSMATAEADCVHPYPCGDEWPSGLAGPFDFDPSTDLHAVDVPTHDGTLLHGWVARPALPAGVLAPTIIQSSPYIGLCIAVNAVCVSEPDEPGWWADPPSVSAEGNSLGVAPIRLVRMGYAVAYFNMRGTGRSGGCFGFFGLDDRTDQGALVNWVAAQDWSNGRVAFGGGSFLALTAFHAAVEAPAALKTVIVAGQLNDLYQHQYTPQGARSELHRPAYAVRALNHSFGPYLGSEFAPGSVGAPDPEAAGAWATALQERACSSTADSLVIPFDRTLATGAAEATYWDDRRPFTDAPRITAAILAADGFRDVPDHQFQGDLTWGASPAAPKRLFYGWWIHGYPTYTGPETSWADTLLPWLEYWLKGAGPRPALGVDYQDEGTEDRFAAQSPSGAWRHADHWPPAESREEVLYLNAGGSLAPDPDASSRSYLSVHHPMEFWRLSRNQGLESEGVSVAPSLCQLDPLGRESALLYLSEPAASDVVLAGNPMAHLRVSRTADGGLVHLALLEVAPDFGCDEVGRPNQSLYKIWASDGAADLQYLHGNYDPEPFPVSTPTGVRIDLSAVARRIERGHRLGVLVYGGEVVNGRTAQPQGAQITLHSDGGPEASHLVLPIVQGSFGGHSPTLDYSPRPFMPDGFRE